MVWPTLESRTAKKQKRTEQNSRISKVTVRIRVSVRIRVGL